MVRRRSFALAGSGVALAGLVSLGAAACAASPPPPDEPSVSVPRVVRAPALVDAGVVAEASVAAPPPGDAGAPRAPGLENAPVIARFFDALRSLEDHTGTGDVRILQLGDSHTIADYFTGPLRRTLQARFGDGGRGLVAIGKPAKAYVQENVKVGMGREWTPVHVRLVRHQVVGDGLYGLSSMAVESKSPGGSAWVDIDGADRAELFYLAGPRGGPFDLLVDGQRTVRLKSRSDTTETRTHAVELGAGEHRVEVVAASKAPVRLFGVAFDRKQKGVVLDAAGRDGARAAGLLQLDDAHFQALVRARDPALVILAFGSNECGDKDIPDAALEKSLVEVLGRLRRAAPAAACLVLGPPDYVERHGGAPAVHPRLAGVILTQRAVAQAAGCAFFDQQAAMGGPASHAAWADEVPPRARKDGVHLSREGYASLAQSFSAALLGAYEAHRQSPSPAP